MNKENKKEAVTYLLIILFIILVRTYVVTPVRVSGSSMANTLKNGEILLLNKFEYRFSDIKRFFLNNHFLNAKKNIKRF